MTEAHDYRKEREIAARINRASERVGSLTGDTANAVGDVMAGESAENRRAANLMRKIKSDPNLQLDESDLFGPSVGGFIKQNRQVLTERMPAATNSISEADRAVLAKYGISLDDSEPASSGMLTEEDPLAMLLPEERAAVLASRRNRPQLAAPKASPPQRQMLTDSAPKAPPAGRQMLTETPQAKPAAKTKSWVVKQFVGETAGGKSVPVWKVLNSTTGFSMDKLFRAESVANKIAFILNETGNISDPRIVAVIGAYDKRNQLLKEIRNMEAQKSTNPAHVQRLQSLRGALTQIDYKLGI